MAKSLAVVPALLFAFFCVHDASVSAGGQEVLLGANGAEVTSVLDAALPTVSRGRRMAQETAPDGTVYNCYDDTGVCQRFGTVGCSAGSPCMCDKGWAGSGGSDTDPACSLCPRGTFKTDLTAAPSNGEDECSVCPAGTPGGNLGNKNEAACDEEPSCSMEGMGLNEQGVCTECPAGTFSDGVECLPCSAGTWSYPGSTQCNMCAPGYSGNAPACSSCPVGSYKRRAGADPCVSCAAGHVAPNTATSECEECPLGHVSNTEHTSCSTCEAGKYPNAAGDSCLQCPGGTWTRDENGVAITTATSGADCRPCPAGMFATADGGCQAETLSPPTFLQELYSLEVSETESRGTIVAYVVATPADTEVVTYSMASPGVPEFNVQPSGAIVIAVDDLRDAADGGIISFSVQASGYVGAGTDTALVQVTVADVDEHPVWVTGDGETAEEIAPTLSVLELAPVGTVVGQIVATDPDGDQIQYELFAQAGSPFAIDTTTGEITTTDVLNSVDAVETYQLTVQATDMPDTGEGYPIHATITVKVIDEDEPPAWTQLDPTATFSEGSSQLPGADTGGVVWAEDPDGSGVTYQVDGGGGLFEVKFGDLQVAAGHTLDMDVDGVESEYELMVTATSGPMGALQHVTANITVYVYGANDEVPTWHTDQGDIFQVTEHSEPGTVVGELWAEDVDGPDVGFTILRVNGQEVTSSSSTPFAIEQPSSAGNGVNGLTVGKLITSGDSATVLDAEGTIQYTLDIEAHEVRRDDDGNVIQTVRIGTYCCSTHTFTVTVENINDEEPEVIAAPSDPVEVDKNAGVGDIVTAVAAIPQDAGASSIAYSIESIIPEFGAPLFTLDSTTGVLTVAGALDAHEGTQFTLVVRAMDDTGLHVDTSIVVTVPEIVDPPVVVSGQLALSSVIGEGLVNSDEVVLNISAINPDFADYISDSGVATDAEDGTDSVGVFAYVLDKRTDAVSERFECSSEPDQEMTISDDGSVTGGGTCYRYTGFGINQESYPCSEDLYLSDTYTASDDLLSDDGGRRRLSTIRPMVDLEEGIFTCYLYAFEEAVTNNNLMPGRYDMSIVFFRKEMTSEAWPADLVGQAFETAVDVSVYIEGDLPYTPSPVPTPSSYPTVSPTSAASPVPSPSGSPAATTGATPSTSAGASPAETPASTPAVSPSTSAGASPAETPASTPAASPSASPDASPAATPAETPAPSAAETPAPSSTAAASAAETPAATPDVSPSAAESPAGTPVASPYVFDDAAAGQVLSGDVEGADSATGIWLGIVAAVLVAAFIAFLAVRRRRNSRQLVSLKKLGQGRSSAAMMGGKSRGGLLDRHGNLTPLSSAAGKKGSKGGFFNPTQRGGKGGKDDDDMQWLGRPTGKDGKPVGNKFKMRDLPNQSMDAAGKLSFWLSKDKARFKKTFAPTNLRDMVPPSGRQMPDDEKLAFLMSHPDGPNGKRAAVSGFKFRDLPHKGMSPEEKMSFWMNAGAPKGKAPVSEKQLLRQLPNAGSGMSDSEKVAFWMSRPDGVNGSKAADAGFNFRPLPRKGMSAEEQMAWWMSSPDGTGGSAGGDASDAGWWANRLPKKLAGAGDDEKMAWFMANLPSKKTKNALTDKFAFRKLPGGGAGMAPEDKMSFWMNQPGADGKKPKRTPSGKDLLRQLPKGGKGMTDDEKMAFWMSRPDGPTGNKAAAAGFKFREVPDKQRGNVQDKFEFWLSPSDGSAAKTPTNKTANWFLRQLPKGAESWSDEQKAVFWMTHLCAAPKQEKKEGSKGFFNFRSLPNKGMKAEEKMVFWLSKSDASGKYTPDMLRRVLPGGGQGMADEEKMMFWMSHLDQIAGKSGDSGEPRRRSKLMDNLIGALGAGGQGVAAAITSAADWFNRRDSDSSSGSAGEAKMAPVGMGNPMMGKMGRGGMRGAAGPDAAGFVGRNAAHAGNPLARGGGAAAPGMANPMVGGGAQGGRSVGGGSGGASTLGSAHSFMNRLRRGSKTTEGGASSFRSEEGFNPMAGGRFNRVHEIAKQDNASTVTAGSMPWSRKMSAVSSASKKKEFGPIKMADMAVNPAMDRKTRFAQKAMVNKDAAVKPAIAFAEVGALQAKRDPVGSMGKVPEWNKEGLAQYKKKGAAMPSSASSVASPSDAAARDSRAMSATDKFVEKRAAARAARRDSRAQLLKD